MVAIDCAVAAYVTNVPTATPAQLIMVYRKRADAENVFDELKNQWGFADFCSKKAVVSETAARLRLLTYNLWSLFVRVVKDEGVHTEAVTSRDKLLLIPAKLVESGRQKTLKLAVSDKWWTAIAAAYQRLQTWLRRTAPQWEVQQSFERYLCWHNPLSPDNWLATASPGCRRWAGTAKRRAGHPTSTGWPDTCAQASGRKSNGG
jgi:hypothetical protein